MKCGTLFAVFPSVSDYYRTALRLLSDEVKGSEDAAVLGMDTQEWIEYLVRKYGMQKIEFDPAREVRAFEASIERDHPSMGSHPVFRIEVPVVPSDTLQAIFEHTLVGRISYMLDYKRLFQYRDMAGVICTIVEQSEHGIADGQAKIGEYVTQLNDAIEHENRTFPTEVQRIVTAKQQTVRAKHQHLDELANKVGITIVKRSDVSKIIPTAVTVRREIAAIVPPTAKLPQRIALDRDRFDMIFDVIDQQCRQFERTPGSFNALTEEGLRDVMLSSLNAVFRGAATGETFQGLGKADIHLRIAEGEVFIAELKFWDGVPSLVTVVRQLLERLTWRDAFGVAIVLSRNADFGQVLRSMVESISSLPGFVSGSQRKVAENRHAGKFVLPSDASRTVEIHIAGYNLYTPRRVARATKNPPTK